MFSFDQDYFKFEICCAINCLVSWILGTPTIFHKSFSLWNYSTLKSNYNSKCEKNRNCVSNDLLHVWFPIKTLMKPQTHIFTKLFFDGLNFMRVLKASNSITLTLIGFPERSFGNKIPHCNEQLAWFCSKVHYSAKVYFCRISIVFR